MSDFDYVPDDVQPSGEEDTLQPEVSGLEQPQDDTSLEEPVVDQPEGEVTEEVFYDATKVPPALQATFRAMQKAWTQKNQEVAAFRKAVEPFGSPDEVVKFVSQFETSEGIIDFIENVLVQGVGVSPERFAQLFQDEPFGVEEPGYDPDNDPDRPITRREWQQMQEEQRQTELRQREDQEVISSLKELDVPDELRDFVLAAAYRQPFNLGYAERIKRGYEQVNKALEARAAKLQETEAQNRRKAPKSLSGSTPTGEPQRPKSYDEARRNSQAMLDALDKADAGF